VRPPVYRGFFYEGDLKKTAAGGSKALVLKMTPLFTIIAGVDFHHQHLPNAALVLYTVF
jgi:hypothetical protein